MQLLPNASSITIFMPKMTKKNPPPEELLYTVKNQKTGGKKGMVRGHIYAVY